MNEKELSIIRLASRLDIPFIVEMYSKFVKDAGYCDIFTMNTSDFVKTLEIYIDNETMFTDGKYGVLAFVIIPTIANHAELIAYESIFLVSKDGRGSGTGSKLIKAAEDKAGSIPVKAFIMSTPTKHNIEYIEKYYQKIGYNKLEHTYIKEL